MRIETEVIRRIRQDPRGLILHPEVKRLQNSEKTRNQELEEDIKILHEYLIAEYKTKDSISVLQEELEEAKRLTAITQERLEKMGITREQIEKEREIDKDKQELIHTNVDLVTKEFSKYMH